MKLLNKLFALTTVLAMLGASTQDLSAQNYQNNQGSGYEDSSQASGFSPVIALGAIAVIAIVAVAVSTSGHGHGHHHGHSSSSSSSN